MGVMISGESVLFGEMKTPTQLKSLIIIEGRI